MRKVFILLYVCCVALSINCTKGECVKPFTISGTITDSSRNAIEGVTVDIVTHYGFERTMATTDANGKYSVPQGEYSDLGNSYVIYKKAGYQDYSTQNNPIGSGDGTCDDQNIVRDAVMTP